MIILFLFFSCMINFKSIVFKIRTTMIVLIFLRIEKKLHLNNFFDFHFENGTNESSRFFESLE